MSRVLPRSAVMEVTMDELLAIVSKFNGQINRVYWHWSAGRYGQFWEDYPINIDKDGSVYVTGVEDINGDGMTNASDVEEIDAEEATWHRNSGSTAIGTLCMMGATTEDFGEMPLTDAQIEASARVMAIMSLGLNLPLTSEFFMTHCEIAIIDDYGPGSGDPATRWDGYFLHVGDPIGSGGDILRGKANWYLNEYQSRLMKGLSLQ